MREIRRFIKLYQSLASSVLVLLFVLFGFFFGIIPAAKRVLDIRAETVTMGSQISDLRSKAAILTAIDNETYKRILADLVTAVPPDQSLTSLFSTIDGVAAQTGLTLTDLRLTKPGALATESARKQSTEEKQIGTNLLPFAATITGSYEQIREFLATVVRVRRFFRVRGFALSLVDPTNVSVRMTMDAFYAPYLSVIGGVDSKVEGLSPKDEQIIATVVNMPIVGDQTLVEPGSQSSSSVPTVPKENPFAP